MFRRERGGTQLSGAEARQSREGKMRNRDSVLTSRTSPDTLEWLPTLDVTVFVTRRPIIQAEASQTSTPPREHLALTRQNI